MKAAPQAPGVDARAPQASRSLWTAVTLGALDLALLAWFATWMAAGIARGVPAWRLAATALAWYAAAFLAVTLAWFAIAWIYRTPRPREARLGFAGSLRLVWNEWVTLMGSGVRMGLGFWFMREPAPERAARPVLLVHGVLCNAGVWLGMRGRLRRLGLGPIYTISYGPPLASIDDFAEAMAQKIDAIVAETGADHVALVGHSMGGLVARAYVRRYGTARVSRIVTIGTPHAGSVHAWLFLGTSLGQLRPNNAWLGELNALPPPELPIVSIWSRHDSMVAPQASAVLPGARNLAVIGVGHNALLRDDEVIRLVARELQAPR